MKNIKKKNQDKYLDIHKLVEILQDVLETEVMEILLGGIEFEADGKTLKRIVLPSRQIYLNEIRKPNKGHAAAAESKRIYGFSEIASIYRKLS